MVHSLIYILILIYPLGDFRWLTGSAFASTVVELSTPTSPKCTRHTFPRFSHLGDGWHFL